MDTVETALERALAIGGATGVAIVDFQQRRVLGWLDRGSGLDMDKVAYGDSDVMRAKLYTLELLGYPPDSVADILITLDEELHMIRPLPRLREGGIFIYLVLDRARAQPLDEIRQQLRSLEPLLAL
ncbi:hypothetical protein IPZ58_12420 [Streptomyces roseoverticillatus]|uniref:hypothetical protein n=1 Tax=Streptomyces roseoverticillatus TaxID=66429 RepID=UPI001F41988D|nr:hypothetical protein [Streptomyces roseoverticillatus]MCF3102382.1 hypothetical protein [Streptomyces roseoverticillatus]